MSAGNALKITMNLKTSACCVLDQVPFSSMVSVSASIPSTTQLSPRLQKARLHLFIVK